MWPCLTPRSPPRGYRNDCNSLIFILARIRELLLPVLLVDNQPLEIAITYDSAPLGQLINSQWVIHILIVVWQGKSEKEWGC